MAARITHPSTAGAAAVRDALRTRGSQLLDEVLQSLAGSCPPLHRSPRGYLIGPPGLCLSLSHSEDLVLAAAAHAHNLLGIGVDVEHGPVPADALRVVLTSQDDPSEGFQGNEEQWHQLLFSAKECVFKAQDPRLQQDLEFDEIAIVARGGFRWAARALSGRAQKVLAEGPINGNACLDGSRIWCVGLWTKQSTA